MAKKIAIQDDYGVHELMDRASIFMSDVDNYLIGHPSMKGHPEWKAMATTAFDALYGLYQAIGDVHVAPDEIPPMLKVDKKERKVLRKINKALNRGHMNKVKSLEEAAGLILPVTEKEWDNNHD